MVIHPSTSSFKLQIFSYSGGSNSERARNLYGRWHSVFKLRSVFEPQFFLRKLNNKKSRLAEVVLLKKLCLKRPRLVAIFFDRTFENGTFQNQTLKRSVFKRIRNSNVPNSSPNCIQFFAACFMLFNFCLFQFLLLKFCSVI